MEQMGILESTLRFMYRRPLLLWLGAVVGYILTYTVLSTFLWFLLPFPFAIVSSYVAIIVAFAMIATAIAVVVASTRLFFRR
jgi:hypothetical protein